MSRLASSLPEGDTPPTKLWDLLTPIVGDPPASGAARGPAAEPRIPPDVLIAQARFEADAIRAAAISQAVALREDAERNAGDLRAQARQQGYAEGAAAAQADIEADLRAAWEARVGALQADVQAVIDAFAAEREAVWLQTEPDMVVFALEIARKIVKVEVTQNPAVIAEMIRHALRRVVDKENVRVRVNPDELEQTRADRKDLQLVLDGARSLEIIDDRRIGRGGCVIETGAGTIDARIETQFNEVARALESAAQATENDQDDE